MAVMNRSRWRRPHHSGLNAVTWSSGRLPLLLCPVLPSDRIQFVMRWRGHFYSNTTGQDVDRLELTASHCGSNKNIDLIFAVSNLFTSVFDELCIYLILISAVWFLSCFMNFCTNGEFSFYWNASHLIDLFLYLVQHTENNLESWSWTCLLWNLQRQSNTLLSFGAVFKLEISSFVFEDSWTFSQRY